MASQQQALVADTIRAMKLAMRRRASDSESHGELSHHTNRGNKLKRSARYVQKDRLDDTGGLAHKKKVDHAGYTRHIVYRRPIMLDEDGDPYSPTSSDYEAERYGEPAEDNPFGEVQLEQLLRPLTAASELPDHPSLSIPYKTKALAEMAGEAFEMLRRERAILWKAKRLLQRFRGDSDWTPCTTFETEHDEALLYEESPMEGRRVMPNLTVEHFPCAPAAMQDVQNGQVTDEDNVGSLDTRLNSDVDRIGGNDAMEGVEKQDPRVITTHTVLPRDDSNTVQNSSRTDHLAPITNGDAGLPEHAAHNAERQHISSSANADIAEREATSETASQSNGTERHAMTTRARARSPAERSDRTPPPSPSDSASVPAVHAWFIAPPCSLSDRDLGLPAHEAEETRKLLLLYVQKQEQVVRALESLYSGLQKTDRLRRFVLRSCKAEAHVVPDGKGNMVTDMSDGEDWYDMSEWNLQPWETKDGTLEKGKDEVEDVEEERGRRPGRGRRVNRI